MSCIKCTSIHFRRYSELPPLQKAAIKDASDEYLYYVHQDSLLALRNSQATCHLCRKILHGLQESIFRPEIENETDVASQVYLSIWLKDDVFQKGVEDPEGVIHSELMNAHCSNLQSIIFFVEGIPESVHQHLERLSSEGDNDVTTLSTRNMELARIWLQNCFNNHQPCKQLVGPSQSPLRLINISEPQAPFLTVGQCQSVLFATLSYRWGHSKKYLTTSKNLSRHQTTIPLEQLPKTFKESFEVVRALGFSYLWIDALCIQHDVPDELNEQIGRMGEIFTSSSLTVFAAAGNDPCHGLQANRDSNLTKPSAIRMKATIRDWHYDGQFYVGKFGRGLDRAYRRYPEPPLTRRGWVLQEELLSARGLWFKRDEILWSCLCESATERSPGVTMVDRIDKQKLLPPGEDVNTLMNVRYRLRDRSDLLGVKGEVTYTGRGRIEDEWYIVVQIFTSRHLTQPSDVLPALSGVASRIAKIYSLRYVAGLWEEDLQLGLLWRSGPWKTPDDPYIDANTSQPAKRGALADQHGEWLEVSGLGDDWSNVESAGKATFSWISHFLSGKAVRFNHYRKYKLEEDLGIKVLSVNQIPMYKNNPFGKILSVSLRVRARVKKACLADEDVIDSEDGSYRLIDADDFQFSENYVAKFYPDSPDMIERFSTIHCVLCAVAWLQHDACAGRGKGIWNCIGVVPSPESGGKDCFARVGLVEVLDEAWFMGHRRPPLFDETDDTNVREFELV